MTVPAERRLVTEASVDSSVAALVGDSGETGTALDGRYGRRLATLAAALPGQGADPQPPVAPTPPAITYSSAGTLPQVISAASFPNGQTVSMIGNTGTWDASLGKLEIGGGLPTALDFYLYDSDVEFTYVEQTTGGSRVWVWVDGLPATPVPTAAPLSVAAGASIVGKIAFGSVARRRVTIWASNMNAWKPLRCNTSGLVSAAPTGPRIALVGDSWWGGSGTATPGVASASAVIARVLQSNAHIEGVGGSGYLAGAQPFGHASRVARVAAFSPDLIVFCGSINDSAAGLQAAVASTYDAYAAACPGVPMIVFGPQPSNAADALSSTRAGTVQAVEAAADAHPAVIAFHDMIGTASGLVPPAWASGAVYNNGDLVSYKGSVWRWIGGDGVSTGPYAPAASSSWTPVTYLMTGTGTAGATTGDGTRDVALAADGTHPTIPGSLALGILQAAKIRQSLLSSQ